MKEQLITLAQDVAMPASPSTTVGVVAAIVAAIGGVWSWFRAELNDCKKDRKDLYTKVDKLHEDVSNLSLRVGQVERPRS
jgi:hypothetical protein